MTQQNPVQPVVPPQKPLLVLVIESRGMSMAAARFTAFPAPVPSPSVEAQIGLGTVLAQNIAKIDELLLAGEPLPPMWQKAVGINPQAIAWLDSLRAIVKAWSTVNEPTKLAALKSLAETFVSLDKSLSNGGGLPASWATAVKK